MQARALPFLQGRARSQCCHRFDVEGSADMPKRTLNA
jgi:hypothetical protein